MRHMTLYVLVVLCRTMHLLYKERAKENGRH